MSGRRKAAAVPPTRTKTDEVVESTQPEAFIIPRATLESVIAYLGSRPYAEVCDGLPALLALEPYEA